jgi:hypothetical protein
LADRIANGENCIDLIKLISSEAQFLAHSRDVCVRQIAAIEIVHKVHKTTKSQDKEIELPDQLPFSWRALLAPKVLNKSVAHGEWEPAARCSNAASGFKDDVRDDVAGCRRL